MLRTVTSIALLTAAVALPAGAEAQSGITYKTQVKTTLKYTERQDWEVVRPTTHGCAAIGGGYEVLRAETSGRQSATLAEFKEDSHRPFEADLAPRVRWTEEAVDNTTRTPPESEDGSCGDTPRDCGTYPLRSARFSVASTNDRLRLSGNDAAGQPDLQNCFTLGWQQPWFAGQVSNGHWATKRWAAGRPGVHRVTVTKRFPARIKRNTDYGDVRVTGTVTFELTYTMPAKRGRTLF